MNTSAHNHVRRPVRSVQELSDALGSLPVIRGTTPAAIAAEVGGKAYGPTHPGRARLAAALDDGSPSMLAEPTRTIMAGNGVVEQFDEITGPLIGDEVEVVGMIHSLPRVAGLPSPAASLGAGAALSSSGAMAAPRDTSTPAASANAAGAFRLSPAQRESLEMMARAAVRTSNFGLLREYVETLVHADRFDRAIAEGEKSIGKVFANAAEMVKSQTRKAVAKCNACPKCGAEIEHVPDEPGVNMAGGYICSDADCDWSGPHR